MAQKNYNQCDAVLDVFPTWKYCGKPVKAPGTRCAEHPIKKIWPSDDDAPAPENNLLSKDTVISNTI
jgi:hypothetical protein